MCVCAGGSFWEVHRKRLLWSKQNTTMFQNNYRRATHTNCQTFSHATTNRPVLQEFPLCLSERMNISKYMYKCVFHM